MQAHSLHSKINLRFVFFAILLLQLAIMLISSQKVGISADERRHYRQAEKVYNYYMSKGEDKAALEKTGIDPMQYNGQSFDNVMFFIEKTFDVKNNMEMRHFFNAIIGWLILLITGLIAKELWGYQGAILAIILLFISPRFIGHALNNNKDIPFALGFILAFYGTIRFLKELPKPKLTSILWLALGIAFAISIRLAGLITIAFLGLYSAIYFLIQKPYFKPFAKNKVLTLKKLVVFVPPIIVIAYFLGILLWPFMLEAPIKNIKVVLDATASHPVSLNQLFEGQLIQSKEIPHHYSLRYLSLTYPLVILLGMLLSLILLPFNYKKENLFSYFQVAFAFVFVFTWMSLKNSNFYGGIRHLLFIYPLAVIMAVLGYKYVLNMLPVAKKQWHNYAVIAIITVLSIHPLSHNIRNYPYSYVYFNELSGGIDKVKAQYETDFFQHSLKHATQWFINNELATLPTDSTKIKVVTNDGFNTKYYMRPVEDKVSTQYVRYYEKTKEDWDYAIYYCGYIEPSQIANGLWPPKGTIHTELVDGFPIAAVIKRVSDEDFKGFTKLKKGKTKEAKQHFKSYLKIDPDNTEVIEGYANAMLRERKYDSTIVYADSALHLNPRQIGAMMLKASAYNTQKKYEEANQASTSAIALKEAFGEAHFQKGYALKNLNQANEALKSFQRAAAYKKNYYQAYIQMGEILINYKQYKKAIAVYDKVFEFRKNDEHATIQSAKCHHLLKDNAKANKLIRSLSQRSQNTLEAVKLRCRIALSTNDITLAGQLLNMARNFNNNADLWVVRALYVLKQSRIEQAKQYLEQAKKLDLLNREAEELLKSLNAKPKKSAKKAQHKPKEQQSIMFQKAKPKKKNQFQISNQ